MLVTFNLIRLRRVGISPKGSGRYRHRIPEGFRPASDEATSEVVFINHELTKTGVCLLKYHLIPPELHETYLFECG